MSPTLLYERIIWIEWAQKPIEIVVSVQNGFAKFEIFVTRRLGYRSVSSACQRLRDLGLVPTIALLVSAFDDKYIRSIDRWYHTKTSGVIQLNTTSFIPSRLCDATQYAPVYGWAFRRLLKQLGLPREYHFADLGCGLGRACILAAEYGFEKVTGVDLAAEFCEQARQNVINCHLRSGRLTSVTILQLDAIDYCDQTDDDVFFMFRPFSEDFLNRVLEKLAMRARSQRKDLTIIYSERAGALGEAKMISSNPAYRKLSSEVIWGQTFHVFQCSSYPLAA